VILSFLQLAPHRSFCQRTAVVALLKNLTFSEAKIDNYVHFGNTLNIIGRSYESEDYNSFLCFIYTVAYRPVAKQ
jgi:hypothetical protein